MAGEIVRKSGLTAAWVKTARPKDKPYKLSDRDGLYTKEQMTGHGFRAMAATLLNEMGTWNPDAIERQLAHADGNSIRRAYARGQYWDERVRMMQHWSDYLDQLRDGATILRPKFGHSGS